MFKILSNKYNLKFSSVIVFASLLVNMGVNAGKAPKPSLTDEEAENRSRQTRTQTPELLEEEAVSDNENKTTLHGNTSDNENAYEEDVEQSISDNQSETAYEEERVFENDQEYSPSQTPRSGSPTLEQRNFDNEEKTEEELYSKGIEFRNAKKFDEAKECFLPLAENGYVKAQHNLAMCFYHMDDEATAYEWFKIAAENGFEPSANNIHKLNLIYNLLNDDLLVHIASFLDVKDFLRFKRTSRRAYEIGTSSALVICEDPEDAKTQILSHESLDDLFLKAKRTKNGFNLLALGFELLADDVDILRSLAHSYSGASRILTFRPFILKEDPSRASIFEKLIKNAKILWKEEAKEEIPLAQFNYGILQLVNGEVEESSLSFEKAVQNGFQTALHTFGISTCLVGQMEEGYHLIALGIRHLLKEESTFKRDYNNLVDLILLPFGLKHSKEAAFLVGERALFRKDFKTAEKLLSFADIQDFPRGKVALAKLYHKMGRLDERNLLLRQAAEQGNSYAKMELAALCFKSDNVEEGFTWIKQIAENADPLMNAVLAYKLAKTAIAKNDSYSPILEEAKKALIRAMGKQEIDTSPDLFQLSSKHDKKTSKEKLKEWLDYLIQNERNYTLQRIVDQGNTLYHRGDIEKAKPWWLFAAQFNEPVSQNNLGVLAKEEGKLEEAKTWYSKSASKGYDLAAENLCGIGSELYTQTGNIKSAREWWVLAAQYGHTNAQYLLGLTFEGENNIDEAYNWLMKAAKNGHKLALDRISMFGTSFYNKGQEIEAVKYWEFAAALDQSDALCNLGHLASKRGNYKEAKKFLFKAGENGNEKAINNIFVIASQFGVNGNLKKAKRWFELAAQFEHADAQFSLGLIEFENGNIEEAKEWFTKSAENGFVQAINNMALIGANFYKKGKMEEAKDWWELAAAYNHEGAKHCLKFLVADLQEEYQEYSPLQNSTVEQNGLSDEENKEDKPKENTNSTNENNIINAISFLLGNKQLQLDNEQEKIASSNELSTENNIRNKVPTYEEDIEFLKQSWLSSFMNNNDPAKLESYMQTVKEWLPAAQYKVGLIYYNGEGVARNYIKAMKWLKKSAEHGFSQAQRMVGVLYYDGCVVYYEGTHFSRLYTEALKWFEKAKESGHPEAQQDIADTQYQIAKEYSEVKNFSEALKWLKKAYKSGKIESAFNIGIFHREGRGVPQNYPKALKWLKRAADNTDLEVMETPLAQYNLGEMYYKGEGVPQSNIEALKWFEKAKENGDQDAQEEIDAINKKMKK